MSVQDNLLYEKNIALEQPGTEAEEYNQMCSFNSDEMEDMCYLLISSDNMISSFFQVCQLVQTPFGWLL